jgi:cytochrome c-type biogenesis protein CcmF
LYQSAIILLCGIGAATAIGMSMPFISSMAFKRNVAIQEWLYHQVLSWAYVPVVLLIAIVPFVSWRSMSASAIMNRVLNILTISVGATGICLFVFRHPDWGIAADVTKTTLVAGLFQVPTVYWVGFLVFLSLFAATANIWRMVETMRRAPMSIGGFISHIGLAVFMAGMAMSRGLERREQIQVQRSRPEEGLGYVVALKTDPKPDQLFNRDNKLEFEVQGPDGKFTARPGLYYTDSNEGPKPMVWPHIQRFGTHDVYLALGPPAMNFWKEPQLFKKGESRTLNEVTVTYHGYTMDGNPGQPGAKFIANVDVAYQDSKFNVNPVFAVQGEPTMPVAGEFRVLMTRIDAATGGAELQLFFREAVYPIDMYYKPMTGLVWAGAGILTFGGLLAAFYRRPKYVNATERVDEEAIPAGSEPTSQEHAPAPVA